MKLDPNKLKAANTVKKKLTPALSVHIATSFLAVTPETVSLADYMTVTRRSPAFWAGTVQEDTVYLIDTYNIIHWGMWTPILYAEKAYEQIALDTLSYWAPAEEYGGYIAAETWKLVPAVEKLTLSDLAENGGKLPDGWIPMDKIADVKLPLAAKAEEMIKDYAKQAASEMVANAVKKAVSDAFKLPEDFVTSDGTHATYPTKALVADTITGKLEVVGDSTVPGKPKLTIPAFSYAMTNIAAYYKIQTPSVDQVTKLSKEEFGPWLGGALLHLSLNGHGVPHSINQIAKGIPLNGAIHVDAWKGLCMWLSGLGKKSQGAELLYMIICWMCFHTHNHSTEYMKLIKASTWLSEGAASVYPTLVDVPKTDGGHSHLGAVDFGTVESHVMGTLTFGDTSDVKYVDGVAYWPLSGVLDNTHYCILGKPGKLEKNATDVGNFDPLMEKVLSCSVQPTDLVPTSAQMSTNEKAIQKIVVSGHAPPTGQWYKTGKFSHSGPNIQELPKKTGAYDQIKKDAYANMYGGNISAGGDLIGGGSNDPLYSNELLYPTGDEMSPVSLDKIKELHAQKKALQDEAMATGKPVMTATQVNSAFDAVKDIKDAPALASMDPPILANAKFMYQETKGTSNPYYVVAVGDGLKVGARWSPKNLAIRFEGPALKGDAGKWLSSAGVELKSGGTYASAHLSFEGEPAHVASLMQRTLLSMIGAAMYNFKSPVPSIERLKTCSPQKSYGL
ncbi:hypothetical protein EVB27_137 [Rhizobium phage RHph_TM16]|nr:hypothetical protein EVB27_137 [Rhizobium phage RHph_TM16]